MRALTITVLFTIGCSDYNLTGIGDPVTTPDGDIDADFESPNADEEEWWDTPWEPPPGHPVDEAVGPRTGTLWQPGGGDHPEAGAFTEDDDGELDPNGWNNSGDGGDGGDDPEGDDGGGVTLDPDTWPHDPGDNPGGYPDDWDDDYDEYSEEDLSRFGRMTGGGWINVGGIEYTHGFTMHCAGAHHANNLQLSWDDETFHLTGLDWGVCLNDPNVDSEDATDFNTFVGVGWGRSTKGEADIWIKLVDGGEPGTLDVIAFEMVGVDDNDNNWMESEWKHLDGGNHQTHFGIHIEQ